MNLPVEIVKLLKSEKLCFLSTSYKDHPHVSLMNFTYLAEEGLFILSSRADTTKVKHMEKNPAVALLLYNMGGDGELPLSCTFHGTATIVHPDRDRFYRESHYKNHQDMGAFITGENISVITVRINHASLSDVKDSVRNWSAEDNRPSFYSSKTS